MTHPPITAEHRFYDLNRYFRHRYGQRVHKISLDAGLTCPNRDGTLSTGGCIYCNPHGSGTRASEQGLSIPEQIQRSKKHLVKRFKAHKFLAYFQSYTNTYAPIQKLRALWESALADEDVVGLSIGTRPDCVSDEALDLLELYAQRHLVWLEFGLQSTHDATLDRINRGHDFAAFEQAVTRTQGRGIQTCAHIIIGLPGESRQHILQTAETLARMPLQGIKLHLLYVVKGTPLDALYQKGQFRCLDEATYVEWVCDVLERLPPHMVIQRLTGEPHSQELRAPQWSLGKRQTLNLIKQTLQKRDTWQGCRVRSPLVTP